MESRVQQPQAPPPPPSRGSENIDNFCRDCGLMFESNTSLQVHLTYHKENLLTRWPPAPTTAPSSAQSQGQIPSATSTRTPTPTTMESKSEPASAPSPISPHYITQTQHFTTSFPHFSQPIHFLQAPLQQQNQFSPNHLHHQFDEGRMGPPQRTKERTSGEQPAEILDLDSNRVHLYNIQQEQQSFYRPYLMSTQQPPPPLPAVGNGWPHAAAPTGDTHYSPAPHPYHPQDIYIRNQPPPPPQNIYYVQESSYAPPAPVADQVSFQPQPVQHRQQERNVQSPAPPPPATPGKKEVKGGEGGLEMMRGKGKGGACKRPKAYECTSCSKWFTSSGHLKRHYGTTLHKNSAQQNGSEGSSPAPGPGRGKGKKSKKQKMDVSDTNSPGLLLESKSPHPVSTSMLEVPKTIGNGNGLSEECPSLLMPAQYAPAPPPAPPQLQQPPAYFYLGDPHLSHQQHHPQFLTQFEGAGGVYNSHPPIPLPSIYNSSGNSSGYPTMEVPLPPFSTVTTSHYAAEITTYQDQNGNGVNVHGNGNSPEPALKKEEPTEESPEVGRGVSPHSSASWLSPGETSPDNNSSGHSPSSENDSESLVELRPVPLEYLGLDESEGKEEPKQLIQCPSCTKTFTRTCYLTQHQNSSHSPEGKPFKCPLCGKKFHLEPALSEHVSKHGGNKPYKCSLCPKDFNHKTDLRRHLCLHTGKKPFNCSDCGKGFIRKDHMTKHTETHRKNSPRSGPPPDLQ